MVTNYADLPAVWDGTPPGQFPISTHAANPPHEHLPSLALILHEFGPFPPYSLVIGQCMDGLPFMLGLDNPRPGALLVVGEHNPAKEAILSTMSRSACRINHPEEVCWSLISSAPQRYRDLVNSRHCQAVISPHERAAGSLVVEMASIIEQRRFGRERGGTHVLMIDDFRSFSPMLSDYSVYLNLKTLITKGPSVGIWPLISARPDDAYSQQGQLLRSFGTYIFEKKEQVAEETRISSSIHQSDFNVIVGGRLIPIRSLAS